MNHYWTCLKHKLQQMISEISNSRGYVGNSSILWGDPYADVDVDVEPL